MQLRTNDYSVGKPHPGNVLSFVPPTTAVALARPGDFPDARTCSNGLDRRDVADDFEVRSTIVANAQGQVNCPGASALT